MRAINISSLQNLKNSGEKFSCVAAYDAAFAHLISEAGIECILVGDSLGMVLQGHDSTLPVTIEHMVYHTQCVKGANPRSLILADMPFMTYGTVIDALDNAAKLMQVGAAVVKLEGGAWLCETVEQMSKVGIPTCIHMGLTPQSVNKLGGYKVQGRQPDQATQMIEEAKQIEEAGADILLLECVPSALAEDITSAIDIPVIGIGAGADTDGQVLVLHDMLGIFPKAPKFSKNFLAENEDIPSALRAFSDEVKAGEFPTPEHGFKNSSNIIKRPY